MSAGAALAWFKEIGEKIESRSVVAERVDRVNCLLTPRLNIREV
jgi:hypothetical protein